MRLLLLLLLALPTFAQYGIARRVVSGAGAPPAGFCTIATDVSQVWARTDGAAPNSTFYVCSNTAAGVYAWELLGAGGGGGGGGAVSSVTAGLSGAMIVTPTIGAVVVDIDTAYVPSKTGSNPWLGPNDFSGATSTKPMKTGTSLPATCAVGEMFYKSDAYATFSCGTTNTWVMVYSEPGRTFFQDDDFCDQGVTAPLYKLGWTVAGSVDGGQPGGYTDHPCAPAINAGVANTPVGVTMRYNSTTNGADFGSIIGFTTATNQEYIFIFRTGDATQVKYRVGLTSSATEPLPTNGIFAQFSNNSGCTTTGTDTNWQFSTRAAGASTTLAGPAVAAQTWYRLRIRSLVAGTWLMSIATSGGAYSTEQAFSTNIPTSTLAPQIITFPCSASANYIVPDYFSVRAAGLAR